MALFSSSYQILDTTIILYCDDEALFQRWHNEYHLFEIHATSGDAINNATSGDGILDNSANATLVCRVQVTQSPKIISIANETISLENHPHPSMYAFHLLTKHMIHLNQNFWWLHANVVVCDEKAVILSGRPKVGKTTMSKALVEQGAKWLADDFCPLHKKTGLIVPFSRTSELYYSPQFAKKSYPPQFLFCYEVPELPNVCEWEIAWKQPQLDWINEMSEFSTLKIIPLSNHWVFRLQFPNSAELQDQIHQKLLAYQKDMLYILRIDTPLPDFNHPATISPILVSEAVLFLMSNLKVSWQALSGSNISAGEWWVALSKLLANTQCFKVKPGYLPDMLLEIRKIVGLNLPS